MYFKLDDSDILCSVNKAFLNLPLEDLGVDGVDCPLLFLLIFLREALEVTQLVALLNQLLQLVHGQ